ncbi:MAG: FAD-dependent oxidoreductase [Paracoccaceae bacterium]
MGEDFIIIYRLSMIDLIPNGSTHDEVVRLAVEIEKAGASILNTGISLARGAGADHRHQRAAPGLCLGDAEADGQGGIPVITSNRINTPEVAEEVLAEGCADMVSMARPFLADAEFVKKAAEGRAGEIAPCIGCNQACLDHTFSGKISSCLVNPVACHETEIVLTPAAAAKRVAVVGAGPAGCAVAMTAAGRGHEVVLFDRAGQIGGQLNMAKVIPGKEEFHGLVAWFDTMVRKAGVELRLGTEATAEALEGFDEVVVATGVTPRDPGIPGETGGAGPTVLSYVELLRGGAEAGKTVAVVGAGGIGFDVAEFLVAGGESPTEDLALWREEWGVGDPSETPGGLAAEGPQPHAPARQVVLMQRKAQALGKGLGKTTGWIHRAQLKMKGVEMLGGVNYERIDGAGLHVSFGEARENPRVIAADTVVLCAGQESDRRLADALAAKGVSAHVIGGAELAAELDAKRAIDQGVRLGAVL